MRAWRSSVLTSQWHESRDYGKEEKLCRRLTPAWGRRRGLAEALDSTHTARPREMGDTQAAAQRLAN